MNKKETAIELYRKVREKQLDDMLTRMPDDKRGVEITNNGITYLAFIRRLTPTECDRLQTVPDWYDWGGYLRDAAPKDDRKWMDGGCHQALLVIPSRLRASNPGVVLVRWYGLW